MFRALVRFPYLAVIPICLFISSGWGCSAQGSSVHIELPDGSEIAPNSSILIKATFSDQGMMPEDWPEAFFSTSVGSFEKNSFDHPLPVKDKEVTITTAGQAEARLFSFGGESGPGNVTVSFVNSGGQNVSARVEVEITGGVSRPSAKGFSISCPSKNICVYDQCSDYRSQAKFRCTVTVKDKHGQNIPNASVDLLIEHKENGTPCTASIVEDPATLGIDFDIGADCDPKDVTPLDLEDTYQYQEGNIIHNPRDGLLTIVAYTQGEEGYNDENDNGRYDPKEFFYDLPEPYVDANDINTSAGYGPDRDESYIDADWGTDGEWDMANGSWDEETIIWTTTHILFSGTPYSSTYTTQSIPLSPCVPSGNQLTVRLYLVDRNNNPIATNDPDNDEICFDDDDYITIKDNGCSLLKNSLGIKFNDYGYPSEILDDVRTYQVTVEDSNSGSGGWTLSSTVTFTPYKDADESIEWTDSINGSSGNCN
jgi:hypothetical protein